MEQQVKLVSHVAPIYFRYIQSMNDVMHDINKMQPVQREFRPEPYEWNSIQVFEHLINVHNGASKGIQFGLLKNKKKYARFRDRWKYFTLLFLLNTPKKFKAPEMVHPKQNLSWEELQIQWSQSVEKLENVLSTLNEKEKDLLVFKHPRAGLLTANQTLNFLHSHVNHHQIQLSKIRSSKAYPRY